MTLPVWTLVRARVVVEAERQRDQKVVENLQLPHPIIEEAKYSDSCIVSAVCRPCKPALSQVRLSIHLFNPIHLSVYYVSALITGLFVFVVTFVYAFLRLTRSFLCLGPPYLYVSTKVRELLIYHQNRSKQYAELIFEIEKIYCYISNWGMFLLTG